MVDYEQKMYELLVEVNAMMDRHTGDISFGKLHGNVKQTIREYQNAHKHDRPSLQV